MIDRRTYLGCSELGAVAGLDPHRGAFDVYLRKTEDLPAEANLAMRTGKALEALVAELYSEETGVSLDCSRASLDTPPIMHRDLRWLGCHPDAIADEVLVECKTAGVRSRHRWGEPGTDHVPEEYLAQVSGALAVLDMQRCDVAVLFGNEEFAIYHVQRDLGFEASLLQLAEAFWRRVERREAPAPDASEAARRWLGRRHPRATTTTREATVQEGLLALGLDEVRRALGPLEERRERLENQLKAAIGDAEGIFGPWGRLSWSACAGRRSVDWTALCAARGITPQELEEFTTRTPYRRFTTRFTTKE